jgi:tetratricopeptide (TPR) repeat protein
MSEPTVTDAPQINWRADLETREFEKALGKLRALALVGRAEPEAESAVSRIVDALEAVRAKNYAGALKTSTEGWRELGLEAAGTNEALEALQRADGNWREGAAQMRADLELARAHWLTRAEAENNLGVLEALAGDAAAARAHFQAALASDPRHYRALTNLGNLEQEAGNLDAAETLYKQVVAINADYSVVYNNLAAVMRKRGKRHESVEYIKKSQRLHMRELRGQTKGTAIGKPAASPLVNLWANPTVRIVLVVVVVFVFWRFVLNR